MILIFMMAFWELKIIKNEEQGLPLRPMSAI